jgi:hypothetical protein
MPLNKLIKTLFSFRPRNAVPVTDAKVRTARHHFISNPWHAVSVVPSEGACAKARSLSRLRFLSNDAPPLPLKSCDARTCRCHYRHHEDRRRLRRRASDGVSIGSSRRWSGLERRQGTDRRMDVN